MAKYAIELKLEIVKNVINGMTQNKAVKQDVLRIFRDEYKCRGKYRSYKGDMGKIALNLLDMDFAAKQLRNEPG